MDFQVNLEKMNNGIDGYTEIINQLDSDFKDVINVIETLSDEAWSGLSQKGFMQKVMCWSDEYNNFLEALENLRDVLKKNIPNEDNLLKEGMSLDI